MDMSLLITTNSHKTWSPHCSLPIAPPSFGGRQQSVQKYSNCCNYVSKCQVLIVEGHTQYIIEDILFPSSRKHPFWMGNVLEQIYLPPPRPLPVSLQSSLDDRVFPITAFHPHDQFLNWEMLRLFPTTDFVYHKKLMIGYHRPKDLRDLVVCANIPRLLRD